MAPIGTSSGAAEGAAAGGAPRVETEPASAWRRVPKQARARERVARILDAARADLEARPVGEITMEGIAERAGVPVGSLYQYFGSKTALLAAVAEMMMDEADAQTARQLVEFHVLPWREAVAETLRSVFEFYRDSPHYRQLLRTIRHTPEFAAITAASNERVADLVSLHPAFARAGVPRTKALVICRVVVTAANALQDRILAEDASDFEVWLEETQRLVRGYLETYLPGS
jgi:AcrR family transcriptional regulator